MNEFQQELNSILYPSCAVAAFLALMYKLRTLRTDRSPISVSLVGNFLFQTLLYAASIPEVWKELSRLTEIENFSGIFAQSCVIVTSAFQQVILLHVTYERKTAWQKSLPRLTFLAAVLASMLILFSMAAKTGEKSTTFAISQATYYPAYLSVYLFGYTANQVDTLILSWRYIKVASTPWLRRGLVTLSVASPFALLYIACRVADIIAAQFGISGRSWEPVASISVSIASIARTLGWTMPDWGPHAGRLWQWINHYRAYREIKPLHREVTSQVPESVLKLDSSVDLRTRLYRLVVEVRDAQWALRTWMTPAIGEAAEQQTALAGLTGADRAATVEAAQLKAAVHAKIRRDRPTDHAGNPRTAEPTDLAAEIAFQRKLARAYARSRIVTSVSNLALNNRTSKELA